MINVKSDEVNKKNNYSEKKKWRVMMRKKLHMIEHRKRRKKKCEVREKIKPGNDFDKQNTTSKRKEKKVNHMRAIVVALLICTSICQRVAVSQTWKKLQAVQAALADILSKIPLL